MINQIFNNNNLLIANKANNKVNNNSFNNMS